MMTNAVNADTHSKLEHAHCPMCGADESIATSYRKEPFAVRRCNECHLWFLSPRLPEAEMIACYSSQNYFRSEEMGVGYSGYEEQSEALKETFRILMQTLAKAGIARGALLEVGAGLGYLLSEATPYFDSLSGVEMSEEARQKAAALSEATLYPDLESLDASDRYECIIATHVIEHVYDPVGFVTRLRQHLAPGGSLVLAAPHMGSFFRKLMGNHWPSFKYPEHVTFFDERTLKALLERAGFKQVKRIPYPHAFPLSLILGKLGLPAPHWTSRINLKLPATTVCYTGKKGTT